MRLFGSLIVFCLFLLKGISGDEPNVYHTVGDDVVLPCVGPSSSSCRSVIWLYNDILDSPTKSKVSDGKINQQSVNAARLSLDTDCSLVIKSIIPEDAGRYSCRRGNTDSLMYLNILSSKCCLVTCFANFNIKYTECVWRGRHPGMACRMKNLLNLEVRKLSYHGDNLHTLITLFCFSLQEEKSLRKTLK
uniref:Ig-like domain-containing protein n=1 Tax=Poecilia latipinna TaxID=48699 RepID=A0A3B3V2V9_9TELE